MQLDQVKGRSVRIIGMLGGTINHVLVSRADPAHLAKLAIAWDSHKHLHFDVPFQDLKPTIYFGKTRLTFCAMLKHNHVPLFKLYLNGQRGLVSRSPSVSIIALLLQSLVLQHISTECFASIMSLKTYSDITALQFTLCCMQTASCQELSSWRRCLAIVARRSQPASCCTRSSSL